MMLELRGVSLERSHHQEGVCWEPQGRTVMILEVPKAEGWTVMEAEGCC